jgi:transposase
MSEPILGVDIAKKKYDLALLFVNGKLKHKVFKNNQEGFGELSLWLKRQEVDHVHVCMEASSTYGDETLTSTGKKNRCINQYQNSRDEPHRCFP